MVIAAIAGFTADRRKYLRIRRHDNVWLFEYIRSDAVPADRRGTA